MVLILISLPFGSSDSVLMKSKVLQGWNLVSFTVIDALPTDYSDKYDLRIYFLDPIKKEYFGGTLDEFEDAFFQIIKEDGDPFLYGYWLYSNSDFEIDFRTLEDSEISHLKDYFDSLEAHLIEGWNLISINDLMLEKSFLDVKGNCEFESVYHFERGQWFKQTESDLSEEFTLDSIGFSLAVKVDENCKLDYSENSGTSEVPSLPN